MAHRTITTNQTGTAQSASKKNVLCVFHNDLVDSDNLTSAVVWAKMVQRAKKEHGPDAVKSFFVFEPHKVNLGIRRIQGTDIPFILMPMCIDLFKKNGLITQHMASIPKHKNFGADLKKVQERHETNPASTVVRADLTADLVKAIVKCGPIMEALRKKTYRTTDTVDDAWIETQLNKCVPPRDPKDWKDDSVLAAKLVVQDFVKTLRGLGVVGQQDPFYLDVNVLNKLDAPLCGRMEHPEWLVNNPPLVKAYKEVMADPGLSEDQRRQKVKALVSEKLDTNCQKAIRKIPDDYDPIVKAGKQAEKIFFFGGSSMTILDKLVSAGLGPKIDFAGQGGTKTPQLNLTGNTFNWDLNPYAAYRVLTKQADPEGTGKISSFQIGTTELGKSVAFDGKDVTSIAGNSPAAHSLGRRIATYGVVGNRCNPEDAIMAPATYASHFRDRKTNAVVPINCPDLAALFAAYAPKGFTEEFAHPFEPTKMWIIQKDGQFGVDRVRFGDDKSTKDPAKKEDLYPCKDSMKLWLAKPNGSSGPAMVSGTAALATECAITLAANVKAALNPPQAGTTGSGSAATGQAGNVSTANKATPVRKATGGAPTPTVNSQQPKPQPKQSGTVIPQAQSTGTAPKVRPTGTAPTARPTGTAPTARPTGAAPTASGGPNASAASRLVSRPAPAKSTRQTPGTSN